MIRAGVDCFRLNFSHGKATDHQATYKSIRTITEKLGLEVAIMADLQGPKIRVGSFPGGSIQFSPGDKLTFDVNASPTECTQDSIYVDYAKIVDDITLGDTLLLDDGLIEVSVKSIDGSRFSCEVISGSELKDRKGINKLGGGLSLNGLTDKDFADLKVADELGVDFVAVSFVRNAADLEKVRGLLQNKSIGLVAKIERAEAIDNIDEIVAASDVVMVARGDLGVELGYAKVPANQKLIIERARSLDKAVITATQMMESMVTNTVPTRAEVSDVANAVLDGTDAVMLSAETATGKHPLKVVDAMARVCRQAEAHPRASRSKHRLDKNFKRVDEAIAMASMYTANHLDIRAIICLTESGSTPLWMSRIRSGIPIFGLTRHVTSMRRMCLYRGVYPIYFDPTQIDRINLNREAIALLFKLEHLDKGNRVILTKGDFIGSTGGTNSLKILEA